MDRVFEKSPHIQFASSIKPEEIEQFDTQEQTNSGEWEKGRRLTSAEQDVVAKYQTVCRIEFEKMGLKPKDIRIGSSEQIRIVELSENEGITPGGRSSPLGNKMTFYVDSGKTLADYSRERIAEIYCHETGHFSTKLVIGRKPWSSFNGEKQLRRLKGPYEEALASLFGYLCLDAIYPGITVGTPYQASVPFMISLVENYSKRMKIPVIEGLREFIRAKTVRDFGFQATLTKLYGNRFVKSLNNLEWDQFSDSPHIYGGIDFRREALEVANKGRFGREYRYLQDEIDSGQVITMKGLSIFIKSERPPVKKNLMQRLFRT